MIRIRILMLLAAVFLVEGASAQTKPTTTPEQATRTVLGELAPAFSLTTTDGEVFDLEAHRGRVVVLNFFATWCPPCIEEMPVLQREVFDRFAGDGFDLLLIGREHADAEILAFAKKRGVNMPMASDADRAVFALYAEHTIPRNVVIGPDGRILYQSHGFERPDFDAMVAVVAAELSSLREGR